MERLASSHRRRLPHLALFFGGATLVAAAFRLCLPTARVGLLAVRRR
ncbi:DUF3017 domain-containing protein [Nocardia australiensis]|nr:DUF3017 domain-containing protein [Nocardia australiensis]